MTPSAEQGGSPPDLLRRRLGRHDLWLQWPATYTPGCPVCEQVTIGLMDHGQYVARGRSAPALRIRTTAEPCGCDVTEHAQAMQTAAVQAAKPTLVTGPARAGFAVAGHLLDTRQSDGATRNLQPVEAFVDPRLDVAVAVIGLSADSKFALAV
jgi:hypothetical protein